MNPNFIVIDGKTYRSIDEMPIDVRQKYEKALGALADANGNQIPEALESMNILADKNKNGVPDILENLAAGSSTKIIFNGKEFNSIENLPPEARQKYEKALGTLAGANSNRPPDIIDGTPTLNDENKVSVINIMGKPTRVSGKVIVNGKEFHGIEDLSPEARARYDQVMGKLDANKNGIPDFVEGMINATNQTANVSTISGTEAPRSTTFNSSPSAMAPLDTSMPAISTTEVGETSSWQLVLAGVFIALLCVAGAAAVWYFFLR